MTNQSLSHSLETRLTGRIMEVAIASMELVKGTCVTVASVAFVKVASATIVEVASAKPVTVAPAALIVIIIVVSVLVEVV